MPGLMKGLVWKMLAIVEAEEDRKAKTWKSNREKWTKHLRAELGRLSSSMIVLLTAAGQWKPEKCRIKSKKVKKKIQKIVVGSLTR